MAGLIRLAVKENKGNINNENTRNEKGRTRGRGGVGWQESARLSQTEPAPDPEESFRSKQESGFILGPASQSTWRFSACVPAVLLSLCAPCTPVRT